MKIDLGCGLAKEPGFIGLDRFPLAGVDVVCDLSRGIPLPDNSVTEVNASHSLEHVDDLMGVMREIYRVCRHGAILCILAPYAHTSVNLANPYHKFAFNEDTPRFFTSNPQFWIPPVEVAYPHIPVWGLGESDNSSVGMDFRCIRMEFFYFPEYKDLPEEEKRLYRRSRLNVVHSVLYHLVAVKAPISDAELEAIRKGPLRDPVHVAHLRQSGG
jgi:SAM-dependent methyltransferase